MKKKTINNNRGLFFEKKIKTDTYVSLRCVYIIKKAKKRDMERQKKKRMYLLRDLSKFTQLYLHLIFHSKTERHENTLKIKN